MICVCVVFWLLQWLIYFLHEVFLPCRFSDDKFSDGMKDQKLLERLVLVRENNSIQGCLKKCIYWSKFTPFKRKTRVYPFWPRVILLSRCEWTQKVMFYLHRDPIGSIGTLFLRWIPLSKWRSLHAAWCFFGLYNLALRYVNRNNPFLDSDAPIVCCVKRKWRKFCVFLQASSRVFVQSLSEQGKFQA